MNKLSYTVDITRAVEFFVEHAGYSYPSAAVAATPEATARMAKAYQESNAQNLASAELTARANGYSFNWYEDDTTNAEFEETEYPYLLWVCSILDRDGASQGTLSGIDLGAEGYISCTGYARVVEAELALEYARND